VGTTQTFQQPVSQQPVYTQQPVAVKQEKNVAAAAILSFFFPGSGQAYNGQTGKGIGIFIGFIITSFIPVLPLIVWIYGVYDAYSTAQKMNKGEIPYAASSTGAVIAFIVVEIIILIVFFAFIFAMMGSLSPYSYY